MENKETPKGRTSPLWYMMGGAAIGTVLGALFAPKKGSELRLDIGEWAYKNRERSRRMMSKISAMIPARVKAAAALGALKAGGAEAIEVVKDDLHLNGSNR